MRLNHGPCRSHEKESTQQLNSTALALCIAWVRGAELVIVPMPAFLIRRSLLRCLRCFVLGGLDRQRERDGGLCNTRQCLAYHSQAPAFNPPPHATRLEGQCRYDALHSTPAMSCVLMWGRMNVERRESERCVLGRSELPSMRFARNVKFAVPFYCLVKRATASQIALQAAESPCFASRACGLV